MKLSRPGAAAPAETGHQQHVQNPTQETTAPAARKGWGASAANSAPANDSASGAVEGQRERIAAQLTGGQQEGDSRQDTARSAFSGGVAKLRESIQQEHGNDANGAGHSNGVRMDPEPPADTAKPRTRRSGGAAADPMQAPVAPVVNVAGHTTNVPDTSYARILAARVALLGIVAPMADSLDEAKAAAAELWEWVEAGIKPF